MALAPSRAPAALIVPAGTVTGATDGPRVLAHYRDMKTADEFVTARMEAHRAACQDITQDPLVQAALENQRQTAEVMARWNDRRQETVTHAPERRVAPKARRLVKRQAE